jgi:hypothetical protein
VSRKISLDFKILYGYLKAMSMGRPPKPKSERRSKPLRILLNDAERKAVDDFAASKSLDSSAWARATLLAAVGYRRVKS